MTLDLLKHFGAAAIALTICLALFVGDNASEVEDARFAAKQLSHKAGKAAVSGNDKVAQTGGGMIIKMMLAPVLALRRSPWLNRRDQNGRADQTCCRPITRPT